MANPRHLLRDTIDTVLLEIQKKQPIAVRSLSLRLHLSESTIRRTLACLVDWEHVTREWDTEHYPRRFLYSIRKEK